MSYLTTELLTSLLQGGAAANEFLRSKIEEGVNAVLKGECKIVCVNRYCMNLLYAPYWGKQR